LNIHFSLILFGDFHHCIIPIERKSWFAVVPLLCLHSWGDLSKAVVLPAQRTDMVGHAKAKRQLKKVGTEFHYAPTTRS